MKKKKIFLCLPAYNAAKTLEKTIQEVPRQIFDQIILVDDGSTDRTAKIAQRLGLKALRHQKQQGYGAVQKTLYNYALNCGAEMLFEGILTGCRIKEVPIPTRFTEETSSMSFKNALLYVSQALWILFKKIK